MSYVTADDCSGLAKFAIIYQTQDHTTFSARTHTSLTLIDVHIRIILYVGYVPSLTGAHSQWMN